MLARFNGLSLLPANEVEVAFVEDVVSDMPDDQRFRKLADYVVENYLDAGCDFPPILWAENPDHIVIRFVSRFGLLILRAYVRFRNNISMRFHTTIFCAFSSVKKHAVCAFIIRPTKSVRRVSMAREPTVKSTDLCGHSGGLDNSFQNDDDLEVSAAGRQIVGT